MKIVVKADGHNIRLWFPLSILKSRMGYNVTKNALERNTRKDTEDIPLTREQMTEIYNVLKRYIKANGHFNIVEVHSHDGEEVLIRV